MVIKSLKSKTKNSTLCYKIGTFWHKMRTSCPKVQLFVRGRSFQIPWYLRRLKFLVSQTSLEEFYLIFLHRRLRFFLFFCWNQKICPEQMVSQREASQRQFCSVSRFLKSDVFLCNQTLFTLFIYENKSLCVFLKHYFVFKVAGFDFFFNLVHIYRFIFIFFF